MICQMNCCPLKWLWIGTDSSAIQPSLDTIILTFLIPWVLLRGLSQSTQREKMVCEMENCGVFVVCAETQVFPLCCNGFFFWMWREGLCICSDTISLAHSNITPIFISLGPEHQRSSWSRYITPNQSLRDVWGGFAWLLKESFSPLCFSALFHAIDVFGSPIE